MEARRVLKSTKSGRNRTNLLDPSWWKLNIEGAARRSGGINYWKPNKEKIEIITSITNQHQSGERKCISVRFRPTIKTSGSRENRIEYATWNHLLPDYQRTKRESDTKKGDHNHNVRLTNTSKKKKKEKKKSLKLKR